MLNASDPAEVKIVAILTSINKSLAQIAGSLDVLAVAAKAQHPEAFKTPDIADRKAK